MLGRLNMTDEQCKETFRTYAESIFRRHRGFYGVLAGLITSTYSQNRLFQAITTVVKSFFFDPGSQEVTPYMFAAPPGHCNWYSNILQE